jgi:hypothetical protein
MTTTQQTQQRGMKVPSGTLPSDGLSRFVRAGAWAAMVSGLALVVSMLMEWLVVPYERLGQIEAYFTSSYLVSSGLRLLSIILLLWALISIYERQSRAAGTFGLWAFVVAFFGTALVTVHSPEQEMRALQGLPQRHDHVLGWQCSAEGTGQERPRRAGS